MISVMQNKKMTMLAEYISWRMWYQ